MASPPCTEMNGQYLINGYIRMINNIDFILMEGFLEKESVHLKQKRRRWIVLRQKYLYSYKMEKSYQNETEKIDLSTYYDVQSIDDVGKSGHFQLISTKNKRNLFAENNKTMNEWMYYIKKIQNICNKQRGINNMIPTEINHLCLQFYWIKPLQFNITHKAEFDSMDLFNTEITENGTRIKTNKSLRFRGITEYDDIYISSSIGFSEGIHVFSIKINAISNCSVGIGITTNNLKALESYTKWREFDGISILYERESWTTGYDEFLIGSGYRGIINEYVDGKYIQSKRMGDVNAWKIGDIIKVKLNCTERTITFQNKRKYPFHQNDQLHVQETDKSFYPLLKIMHCGAKGSIDLKLINESQF